MHFVSLKIIVDIAMLTASGPASAVNPQGVALTVASEQSAGHTYHFLTRVSPASRADHQ